MFCSKCGKEIDDEAIICTGCGCQTHNYKSPSVQVNSKGGISKKLDELKKCGYVSIIGGIIIPIIGIIFGALGLNKLQNMSVPESYINEKEEAEKLNKIGTIVSCVIIVLGFIGGFMIFANM